MRTSLCGALAQASSRRDAAEDALHEAVAAAEATLFPSQKRPAKRAKTTPKLKLEPDDQRGHVLRVTKAGAAAVRKASHVTLLATRRGGEVLFTTKDVARRASDLLQASKACHAASAEILRECSKVAGTFRAPLRNAARLVGDVDALLALAECASQRAWTRPTVDGKALTIEGLRHPLVDEAVSDYIPSDVKLGGDGAKNRCWLVTGAPRRPFRSEARRIDRAAAVTPSTRRRSEHGRQVDLRARRGPGVRLSSRRLLRPGRERRGAFIRSGLRARRIRRRPACGPVDVRARDARDGRDPEERFIK